MRRTLNRRSAEWKWGQALDLSLSFTPEKVEGVVRDAATGDELYRCLHEAKDGFPLPVPAGRPCLFVSGDMKGRVEDVTWAVEDEVPDKTREFPAYRPVGPETGIRGKAGPPDSSPRPPRSKSSTSSGLSPSATSPS